MKRKRKYEIKRIAAAILILLQMVIVPAAKAEGTSSTPLAEGDVIYQVLVDRFSNGDTSNDNIGLGDYNPSNLGMYHGGDWKGLKNNLQYIKNLGVTAVWISPVSKQQPLSRDGTEASYHGYFTNDFATPNVHFGSLQDLKDMVSAGHLLGLKMILDVVPNHTADYLQGTSTTYSPSSYSPAYPMNISGYYHHYGDCLFNGYETQYQLEVCDLGGLDDLDQSNSTVDTYLKSTYKDWIQNVGFDGVRVDAARSIPQSWLQSFEQYLGVPSFGEIFDGNIDYVASYQNYEWGVLDFPFFFNVRDTLSTDSSMNNLSNLFSQDYKYSNPNRLETFIDNHDRARFLARSGDNYQRLRSALALLLTARGVPVIYYGTEQADNGNMNGNEIPIANKDNRKDLSSFSQTSTIYNWIQRLTSMKANYPALRTGTQREMWTDSNVYAFSRRVDTTGAEAMTVISNSWDNQTRTIPIRAESSLTVGTTLTNLLNTSQTVVIQSGGVTGKQITVSLGEHEAKVFVPGTPFSTFTPAARNVTTINVHYNVGWGNSVSIRGNSDPLSWYVGRSARNIASDVWQFQVERIPNGQYFEFKPLINDSTWSQGGNFSGYGGQTIDVYPTF